VKKLDSGKSELVTGSEWIINSGSSWS